MKLYLILSVCKRGGTGLHLGEWERNSVNPEEFQWWKHPGSGWTGLWAAWWSWRCAGVWDIILKVPSSPSHDLWNAQKLFYGVTLTAWTWIPRLWNSHLALTHGYAHPANLRLERTWKTSNNVVEQDQILKILCFEKNKFWEDHFEKIMFWEDHVLRSCFKILFWEDHILRSFFWDHVLRRSYFEIMF